MVPKRELFLPISSFMDKYLACVQKGWKENQEYIPQQHPQACGAGINADAKHWPILQKYWRLEWRGMGDDNEAQDGGNWIGVLDQ